MSELHDLLHAAEPPTASFSPADVRDRADAARRRTRHQVTVLAVVLLAVVAGAVVTAWPQPTVQVITPAAPAEALEVFEQPVFSRSADFGLGAANELDVRLAREVDGVSHFVSPSAGGGVCLTVHGGDAVDLPREPDQCPAVPQARTVWVDEDHYRAVFVVPDGVDTVTWQGITGDVEGNVASLPLLPADTTPVEVTMPGSTVRLSLSGAVLSGPGGQVIFDDPQGTITVDLTWLDDVRSADAALAQGVGEALAALDPPRSASRQYVYGAGQVGPWQLAIARATGDRLCLVALGDAPAVVDQVRCVTPPVELPGPPFVTTMQLRGPVTAGWAAVVPTEHEALVLADGRSYPIVDHVLGLPDLADLPVTGTLTGPAGAQVVTIGAQGPGDRVPPSEAEPTSDAAPPLTAPTTTPPAVPLPTADGVAANPHLRIWQALPSCAPSDLADWAGVVLGEGEVTLAPAAPADVGDLIPLLRRPLDRATCATVLTSPDVHAWELRDGEGAVLARAAVHERAPDGGVQFQHTDSESYQQVSLGSGQAFFGLVTPDLLDGAIFVRDVGAHLLVELPGLSEETGQLSNARLPSLLGFETLALDLALGPVLELPAPWTRCSGNYFEEGRPWLFSTVTEGCVGDVVVLIHLVSSTTDPDVPPSPLPDGAVRVGRVVVEPLGPTTQDLAPLATSIDEQLQ